MQHITPPVTIIKTDMKNGSMGYGCRIDGRTLCIPYNQAIAKKFTGMQINIAQVSRDYFNALPMHKK